MSIKSYLEHRQLMRLIAVLLTILMLYSCLSICMIDAEAAALEIGISLIALILSGFGVVASTTGAIDGMNQGLESLMGEFSESQGQDTGWFRSLFNTDNITSKGYNRLGVGGVLVASIKLFIEWLRADKDLAPDTPIVNNNSGILIDNVIVPLSTGVTLNSSSSSGDMSFIVEHPIILPDGYYEFGNYYVELTTGYDTRNNKYWLTRGNGTYLSDIDYAVYSYQDNFLGFAFIVYMGSLYAGPIAQNSSGIYVLLTANNVSGTNRRRGWRYLYTEIGESVSSGWQIDDDNLDTDYLDNDDGSTKDVIFTPAFPADMPLDDLDLGTIGGMEEAAGRTYEHTQTQTGTATGTGEITTEVDLPSDGGGDQPDISIPEGGFFSTIWHYVVQALQDSAAGIAFIFQIVRTVIPPAILNLAWASCVLLITFGILNKFLK